MSQAQEDGRDELAQSLESGLEPIWLMGPEQVAGFLREYSVTDNWLGLMMWVTVARAGMRRKEIQQAQFGLGGLICHPCLFDCLFL